MGRDAGTQSASGTRFNPTFPAVCPYVTAVGATQVNPNSTITDPEGACEQVIFSGGGFSNVFSRPSYQDTAVQSFLTNHPPPYSSAVFNTSKVRLLAPLKNHGADMLTCLSQEDIRTCQLTGERYATVCRLRPCSHLGSSANYVVAVDGSKYARYLWVEQFLPIRRSDFSLVFGTSASSPVVGSILTLVNDARLAVGKKPIGP